MLIRILVCLQLPKKSAENENEISKIKIDHV